MAGQHRIICTTQLPLNQPTTHAHIVGVGTGTDPSRYTRYWTLEQVLAAMRTDSFYTVSPSTGKIALIRRATCGYCRRDIIKSAPDAVKDNNLDYLPRCSR